MKVRFQIYLEKAQKAFLDKKAKEKGVSVAHIIRRLVDRHRKEE